MQITELTDQPIPLPPTPQLSRKLFKEKGEIPPPESAEEIACANDGFHTIVARIINQAIPGCSLVELNSTIRSFFERELIYDETGLSVVNEEFFPTESDDRLWSIRLFRSALMTVVHACDNLYVLQSNTSFRLLRAQVDISVLTPRDSIESPSTSVKAGSERKLDSAARVVLTSFSGLTAD